MLRTVLFLILFLLLQNVSAYRYALLIGQNDGGSSVGKLRFAEEDTKRFADLLVKLADFKKSNVITALNPDSSDLRHHLDKARKLLLSDSDPGNCLFLLYYSGHADGQNLLLKDTKFSLQKVQEFLDSLPAGIRIGIFDACQSGAVAVYKGGARAEPFFLQDQQKVKGQVIIASSAANERAQESQTLKSSVFSFHWLNGLRGSADFSADRKVTLNEAYQYAYRKTVETSALTSGEIQHPSYRFNIVGQGDIMLTDLEKSTGGVLVGSDCQGKFLILSENYLDVFADFYKEERKEVFISLPSGKYTIINARGSDVGKFQFEINRNRTQRVLNNMFTLNTFTESRIKGPDVAVEKRSMPLKPLSRFGLGPSAGLALIPSGENSGWGKNLQLGISALYFINNSMELFFDVSGSVPERTAGADIGLDGVYNLDAGRIFAGAGLGFLYQSKSRASDNTMGPFMTAHLGFSADISKRSQFQLRVPYSVVLDKDIKHRISIEFRLLFWGPYRDVGVIE
jgi:hypothetical protein